MGRQINRNKIIHESDNIFSMLAAPPKYVITRRFRRFIRRGLNLVYLIYHGYSVKILKSVLLVHPIDKKIANHLQKTKDKSVCAIYDLAIYPVTFDFVVFLANAEAYRAKIGAEALDVIIVSEWSDPIQDEPGTGHPSAGNDPSTFINNFITEATILFPSVRSFNLSRRRRQLIDDWPTIAGSHEIFPQNYNPLTPDAGLSNNMVPVYGMIHLNASSRPASEAFCLRPPEEAIDLARRWMQRNATGRPIITITLREAQHDSERNSNIQAWQEALEKLDHSQFTFVILRDHSTLFSPCPLSGPSVVECNEAVMSLPFRAALYELAFLNVLTNGGPASLCYLNHRCNYLVFMEKGDFKNRWYPTFKFQHGVSEGMDLPHATPARKLCWSKDEPDTIVSAIGAACDYLNSSS